MGRSTETLRFAFGSPEEPASSVWRINSRNKTGDVYIHNAPQFGSSIHIALHASGRFSLKLASERFKLEPPFEYQRGFYWGPIFFFRKFRSKLPSIPPSGNQDLINWLGLPAKNNLFTVTIVYAPVGVELEPHPFERRIGRILPVKLFHQEMSLHVFLVHRPLQPEERVVNHIEKLDFKGGQPTALDMIRISKTEVGPSAIIHEPYEISEM